MPIGTSSERVALIRVGMDTGSAEQGAKNLANYFEEADKAAAGLESGADGAGLKLEGLGESAQKLGVIVGQDGLVGDLLDVTDGLTMAAEALGPLGAGMVAATAAAAALAAGAVVLQGALLELTRATLDAEEAAGRKLTPALREAKDTMDGWDGASQRMSRTLTETTAPAFRELSEVISGAKANLLDLVVAASGASASSGTGVARGIVAATSLGFSEIAIGAYENLRGRGRAEMSAGLLEQRIAQMGPVEAVEYRTAEDLYTGGEASKAAPKVKAVADSAEKLAAAQAQMADALRDAPAAYAAWLTAQRQQSAERSWSAYSSAGDVTRGWSGITGEEWGEPEAMTRAQRRDYLRMASGQEVSGPRGIAGLTAGLQGATALAGGMGGVSGLLGAAGPYGAAAAAGIGILSDPQALVKGANEVGKFVEKLPDQIGVMLTEVLPKLMEKLPMILMDLVKAVLIDIPGILIGALRDWWYDVRHTTDAERRQRERQAERHQRQMVRIYGDKAPGAQLAMDMMAVQSGAAGANSRNARSSAPRRPDWGSMQLGPRAPVILTAGVTDDSARAIRRKLATTARGGGR